MTKPLVSVIITAFNRGHTIERAIKSALSQTETDLEIVVIDDASTDNTREVISAISDPRIRLISNPVNRGIGGAKNVGVEVARGHYIAFLDSDDEWLPNKLARQLALLQSVPDAPSLCFTAFWVHRMASGNVVLRCPRKHGTWINSILLGETFSLGSTLVAERKCFLEIGPFNEKLRRLQDRDWTLRYLERYSDFHFVPEPLVRIYNSGWPSPKQVEESTTALFAANEERLRRIGTQACRQFKASLNFEVAVANYRCGNRWVALRQLASAISLRPSVASYLAGRAWRKIQARDSD